MPEQLPEWNATGVEPPQSLKDSGWQPGMKPSAQHMNWLLNRAFKCIEELQQAGVNVDDLTQAVASLEQTVGTHVNDNLSHLKWIETIGGTANALTATIDGLTSYKNGLAVSFPVNSNSTAAMTLNINGLGAIPIKKANGTAFSNAKANGVYSVRYRAGSFILQGDGGAEGNVTPDKVLSPSTYTDPSTGNLTTGTMPNRGAPTITPTTSDQAIAPGYYSGGTVKGYAQERIQSSIVVPSGGKAYVPQPWGNGIIGAYNGRVLSAISQGRTSNFNDVAIAYSYINREPAVLAGSMPAMNHSVALDNTNIVFSSTSNQTFDYVLTKYTGV